MPARGLIAWTAEPHGLEVARALFFLCLILLPFMAFAAPGGIIAADLCLLAGWGAGLLALRRAGRRLAVPDWGWWIASLLFPYLLVMLLGRGRLDLPAYPLVLLQHVYAPCFGLLLVYGVHVFWPERAASVLFRGLALSGQIVVVMDILIFALAATGVYLFAPAFRDAVYTSRLDWPFAQPSQLPGFLLVTFPLSAIWLFDLLAARRSIELAIGVTLLNIVAHATIVVMSGSRAGGLGLMLEVLGVVLLLFLRTPRRKWAVLTVFLSGSILAAASGLLWLSKTNWVIRRSLQAVGDASAGSGAVSTDFRAHNWEFAQRLFFESPLFGTGLSSSVLRYGFEIHSTFLGAFAELGIVGGSAALALLVGAPAYAAWRLLARPGRLSAQPLLAPVLVACGGTMFLGFLHYVLRQRWVWLAIAFLFLLLAESRRAEPDAG